MKPKVVSNLSEEKRLRGEQLIKASENEVLLQGENLDVAWGETHQERILEKSSRSESVRHDCKGRHCDTAFDKL